jgi:hypothetical protein
MLMLGSHNQTNLISLLFTIKFSFRIAYLVATVATIQ